MSTQTKPEKTSAKHDKAAVHGANEVRLLGRVTGDPTAVELPSGDELVTFRISIERSDARSARRQKVDSVPCSAWSARVRRSAMTWRAGDIVEVGGAVRCRFFQTARGLGSRVEVEVASAKLIRRSPDA